MSLSFRLLSMGARVARFQVTFKANFSATRPTRIQESSGRGCCNLSMHLNSAHLFTCWKCFHSLAAVYCSCDGMQCFETCYPQMFRPHIRAGHSQHFLLKLPLVKPGRFDTTLVAAHNMLFCGLAASLFISYVSALALPSAGLLSPQSSVLFDPLDNVTIPASPSISPNLTTTFEVDQLTIGGTICLPKEKSFKVIANKRPKFNDCALALRQLPSDPLVTDFSIVRHRATQGYFLPVDKYEGTCKVTIQLIGLGVTEKSSWMEIGMVANQLNMACFSLESPWTGTTGGRTVAGATTRLEIIMDWNGPLTEDVDLLY